MPHPAITGLIEAAELHAQRLARLADAEIYEPAADVLRGEAARWQDMAAKARAELGPSSVG